MHNRHVLWNAGWFTFKEALGGFVAGSGAAILVAIVFARWRRVGGALMPYAVAASAIPIIAFAPITNAWFGAFNPHSKMAIAAVLCFFPVLVNTLRGLTSVRPEAIELMRSYAASEVDVFRRVRIPSALPFIFAGLKLATVLCMIGAIVGDYFGGSAERARGADRELDLPLRLPARLVGGRRRQCLRHRVLLARGAGRADRRAGCPFDSGLRMGQNRPHRPVHETRRANEEKSGCYSAQCSRPSR